MATMATMLKKVLTTDDRLTYLRDKRVWRYEWRDAADTVAYTETLEQMVHLVNWANKNIKLETSLLASDL